MLRLSGSYVRGKTSPSGPVFGCVYLTVASPVASIGAFLMIIQLAIGPLSQNSLTYPLRSFDYPKLRQCLSWGGAADGRNITTRGGF